MTDTETAAIFTRSDQSTAEDQAVIDAHFAPFAAAAPERILKHLELLKGDRPGYPGRLLRA